MKQRIYDVPYAEKSGVLFGQSVKSAIAETMTAIMDVFWVIFVERTSFLGIFGQSQPT
jgi:hypothetical protein